MHELAERFLAHIRRQELLRAGDRVGIAVSGGIDSIALLRLLLVLRGELGVVLSVVHFNHKLRGAESEADQEFVAGLAREHGLEFHCDSDEVAVHAAEERISVETAARDLRYGFFRYLLEQDHAIDRHGLKPDSPEPHLRDPEGPLSHGGGQRGFAACLNKIATGHTLDDQAETVLMRVIRGAGLRGLGGIHPRILVEDDDGELSGEIIRPLLAIRRYELERYLKDIGQAWREDSSNRDDHFTRNRLRKLVVPLLEREFNPAVAENLADLSEIARSEEDYWENEAAGWLGTTVQWSEPDWARDARNREVRGQENLVQIAALDSRLAKSATVDFELRSKIENAPWLVMNASVNRIWLLSEPVAVQRRLVKALGEYARIPLEFKHVEEILRFVAEAGHSGKELSLPLGWKAVREPEELVFLTPDLSEPMPSLDYDCDLAVPGQTTVGDGGLAFEVRRIPAEGVARYNPDHLLDPKSLPGPLRVRNWRPGDRFWPAHTKSPKKIKKLLQEHHIAEPKRKLWPVVVSGNEIVWMRGFPSPSKFRAKPGQEAIVIEEKFLTEKPAT